MTATYGRHCIIFDNVQIGENTRLGNFVLIRGETIIGKGCVVGSYVDIEGDVRIGNFVSLQSGCYLTRGVIIERASVQFVATDARPSKGVIFSNLPVGPKHCPKYVAFHRIRPLSW